MRILKTLGNLLGNALIFTASTAAGGAIGAYGLYANPLNVDEQKNIYVSAGAGAATAVGTAAVLTAGKNAAKNGIFKVQQRRMAKKIQKEAEEMVKKSSL